MKKLFLMLLVVIMALGSFSCTVSTSVDGASLEFGEGVNENDYSIVSPATKFKPEEEFYFVFNNGNEDFGSELLTMKITDAETDELVDEFPIETEPDYNIYYNTMWLVNPGKYKVAIFIDGKSRATQEIIIE